MLRLFSVTVLSAIAFIALHSVGYASRLPREVFSLGAGKLTLGILPHFFYSISFSLMYAFVAVFYVVCVDILITSLRSKINGKWLRWLSLRSIFFVRRQLPALMLVVFIFSFFNHYLGGFFTMLTFFAAGKFILLLAFYGMINFGFNHRAGILRTRLTESYVRYAGRVPRLKSRVAANYALIGLLVFWAGQMKLTSDIVYSRANVELLNGSIYHLVRAFPSGVLAFSSSATIECAQNVEFVYVPIASVLEIEINEGNFRNQLPCEWWAGQNLPH